MPLHRRVTLALTILLGSLLGDLNAQEGGPQLGFGDANRMSVEIPMSEPVYSVRINFKGEVLQGQRVAVPIVLEEFSATERLGGFEFLISYDTAVLFFDQACQGRIIDSCGWEHFTYDWGCDGCWRNHQTGRIRMAGRADVDDRSSFPYPGCIPYPPEETARSPITLATLIFRVRGTQNTESLTSPIRFLWRDCSDNRLTSLNQRNQFLSRHVYEADSGQCADDPDNHGSGMVPGYGGVDMLDSRLRSGRTGGEEPGYFSGAPYFCFCDRPYTSREPVRGVDFYNGELIVLKSDSVVSPGDINCNGIGFEIADAVMFTHYFVLGLEAFYDHQELSISASDVNRDGMTLGVDDLVGLLCIIRGEEPFRGCPGTVATFRWERRWNSVYVECDGDLGAVYLVVEGEILPLLLAAGMEMQYQTENDTTRILIYSFDPGHSVGWGSLIGLSGATKIISIETATYYGWAVNEVIEESVSSSVFSEMAPSETGLLANYPNPFNPATTIRYVLPEQAEVHITVYNMLGQQVRALVNQQDSPGEHEVVWDGCDDSGHPVSSGLYLYRMTAGDFTQSRKMLLLK